MGRMPGVPVKPRPYYITRQGIHRARVYVTTGTITSSGAHTLSMMANVRVEPIPWWKVWAR